jgi:hypothetical protein
VKKVLRSVLGWAAIAAAIVVILGVLAPLCSYFNPPEPKTLDAGTE